MTAVFLLLFVFAQLGAVDALYYHLWKFRLYAVPTSRSEHWVHTIMSLGFMVVVWGLWLTRPQGGWWWAMAVWQVATLAVTFVDVKLEPHTRSAFGGLTGNEYLMHMLMNTLHGIAIAVWAAVTWSDRLAPTGLPAANWGYPWPIDVIAYVSLAAAVAMPVAHIYLGMKDNWGTRSPEPAPGPIAVVPTPRSGES